MTYTLQGIAGQRYGELTPEEQAQVQGAGQAHVSKIRSTLQPTWSQAHTNELLSGAERDAQEIAQRTAEGIFTAKSDAMRLAERAKETGQVTIGNASTIPNIQAQGQAKLQGAVPPGSAADMLQKGLAAGTVSPTSPEQQFAASMQGSNVNAPGIVPSTPSPDINAKYAQALQQTQATGQPAPPDGGTARQVVQGALPPTPQVNPVLDNLFVEDKNIANFSKMVQDYLSPQTQQQTLKQEYEALTKAQGIEGMKTELMNMKNVIEGAEDDIRMEIQSAGGMGTESQVQALANARNKTLIKNYNNLLQTKQQAEDYVNTLMGLEQADRQVASDRLDKQLNLSFKLMDYQQKMQTNAQSTFQNIVKEVGYGGLYQSLQSNPSAISLVEKTLGLAPNGLSQLATYKKLLTAEEQLDVDIKKAQLKNLQEADTQVVKLDNGQTVLIDTKTGQTIKNLGGQAPATGGQTITGADGKPLQYGTPEYVEQALRNTASSKTKPVASERENLGKFQRVIYQVSDLAKTLNKTATDPIIGTLKSLNPYSFDARSVNAQINALVPNVARGVYGEVGVLTDTDIERYLLTLPNIKSTKQQNDFVTALTLKNAQRAFEIDLLNLASSQINVSGYVDTYKNISKQVKDLESSLGIGSPVYITPQKEQIFDSVVGAPASKPSSGGNTGGFFSNLWKGLTGK